MLTWSSKMTSNSTQQYQLKLLHRYCPAHKACRAGAFLHRAYQVRRKGWKRQLPKRAPLEVPWPLLPSYLLQSQVTCWLAVPFHEPELEQLDRVLCVRSRICKFSGCPRFTGHEHPRAGLGGLSKRSPFTIRVIAGKFGPPLCVVYILQAPTRFKHCCHRFSFKDLRNNFLNTENATPPRARPHKQKFSAW